MVLIAGYFPFAFTERRNVHVPFFAGVTRRVPWNRHLPDVNFHVITPFEGVDAIEVIRSFLLVFTVVVLI